MDQPFTHLHAFQQPCDEMSNHAVADYALLIGRHRQPVTMFAGLECDAQALFASAGEEGWDGVLIDLGENFAQANEHQGYENLGILFVPFAQEEAVFAGFRQLFDDWTAGRDRSDEGTARLGYFTTGLVLFGLVVVPKGTFVLYVQSAEWVLSRESLVDFLGSNLQAQDVEDLEPGTPLGDAAVFMVLDEVGSGNGQDEDENQDETQGASVADESSNRADRFFAAYTPILEDGAPPMAVDLMAFFKAQLAERAQRVATTPEGV